MGKKKHADDKGVLCPVGRFFSELERGDERRSQFFKHLSRARVEFLKAVRSLVDERIDVLERKATEGGEKRTKIEIE
jgi:hypothetical protein